VVEPVTNDGVLELATVRFTAPLVCPCVTANEALAPRLDLREKLSVVAETVRFTVVVFDLPDRGSVASTVTGALDTGAIFAGVVITSVLEVGLTVVKLQVPPLGRPEPQEYFAFPVKFLIGVTVIVVELLACPAGPESEVALGATLKSTAHTYASLFASTDPSPVTRLNPVVASAVDALKPKTPAPGHWMLVGIVVGVLGEQ
jgi:hypothetical protein